MSEEKRKEKQKPKVISRIALIAGIYTFVCGSVIFPLSVSFTATEPFNTVIVTIEPSNSVFDTILDYYYLLVLYSYVLFWPVAVIGLILSIISLYIERDITIRVIPLALVLTGIFGGVLFSAPHCFL